MLLSLFELLFDHPRLVRFFDSLSVDARWLSVPAHARVRESLESERGMTSSRPFLLLGALFSGPRDQATSFAGQQPISLLSCQHLSCELCEAGHARLVDRDHVIGALSPLFASTNQTTHCFRRTFRAASTLPAITLISRRLESELMLPFEVFLNEGRAGVDPSHEASHSKAIARLRPPRSPSASAELLVLLFHFWPSPVVIQSLQLVAAHTCSYFARLPVEWQNVEETP